MACFTNSVFSVYFVGSVGKGPVMHGLFRPASEFSDDVIAAGMKVLKNTPDILWSFIINFNELKLTDGVSRSFFQGPRLRERTEETEETEKPPSPFPLFTPVYESPAANSGNAEVIPEPYFS